MPQPKRTVQAVPDEPEKIVVRWNDPTAPKWSGREIRDFEAVQPLRMMQLLTGDFDPSRTPWDTLIGIVWILHRRVNPSLTFDDVLDLETDQWEIDWGNDDESDPTEEPVEPTAMATGS